MVKSNLLFEKMKQLFETMVQARNHANNGLHELDSYLQADKLLPAELGANLIDALSSSIRLQDEYCALLQKAGVTPPTTISELSQLGEDLERAFQLETKAERARESICMFVQLHCQDEEIADEFKERQLKAEQLLQQPLTDEELIEASRVYELAVNLVLNPDGLENKLELYKQITKTLGLVTRYAIENGSLALSSQMTLEETSATTVELDSGLCEHQNGIPEDSNALASDIANKKVSSLPIVENMATFEAELNASGGESASVEPDPCESIEENDEVPSQEVAPSTVFVGNCIDFSSVEYTLHEKGKGFFSANKFEREIKKEVGSVPVTAHLMDYMYYHGVLALSQLDEIVTAFSSQLSQSTEALRDMMQVVLQKLNQKGYLSAHEITLDADADTYYFLSDYGVGAFRKETSRKFIQSRSQLRIVTRRTRENFVKLAHPHVVAGAYRLRQLNRAQYRLEQELPRELVLTYTGVEPFPHRQLRNSRIGKSFVLIPSVLDLNNLQDDQVRIADTLKKCAGDIPLIIVNSLEEGKWWGQITSGEQPMYFLYFDEQTLVVGDQEAENCYNSLFEIEETKSMEEEAPHLQKSMADAPPQIVAAEAKIEAEQANAVDVNQSELKGASQAETLATIASNDLARVVKTAMSMMSQGHQAEGMMLLHSVANYSPDVEALRSKIGFIISDPLRLEEGWHSLVDTPVNFSFYDSDTLDDYLNAALWLKIFFEPDHPNDYQLSTRWRQINSDLSNRVLEHNPRIKQLIGFFWSFVERHSVGIKYIASADVRDQLDITQSLEQCRQRIDHNLKIVFPHYLQYPITHAKVHHMVTELYGHSGVFTQLLMNASKMSLDELRDECQKFTSIDLLENPNIRNILPEDKYLDKYLDDYWSSMKLKANDNNDRLKGAYRKRMRSWLRSATELLLMSFACRYQAVVRREATGIPPETVRKTRQQALELMSEALDQLEQQSIVMNEAGRYFLKAVIGEFQELLGDKQKDSKGHFYESLLRSGEIELDEEFLPILDEQWLHDVPQIAGFQAWERMLRHCEQELPSWEEAANRALRNYDLGMYDLIIEHCGEQWYDDDKVDEIRDKGKLQARKIKEEFFTAVESAQNYGQMASNDEMYGYFRLAEAAEKHANETNNIGFFKRLLEACRKQITRGSDTRMEVTRGALEALKSKILQEADRENGDGDEAVLLQWPILDKINQMLDKRNMTVAEDYIRLASDGQKDTHSIQMSDKDLYALFMDQYQFLYNACNNHKGVELYRTYEPTVRNIFFPNQNNRNTASAERFIKSWSKSGHLKELLEQLIFHEIKEVKKIPNRENEFYVYPSARDAKLGQYPHPFEAFGTRAVKNGVRVLRMAGMRTVESLLGEVAQHGAGDGSATIVILDYALSMAERRSLAKEIKLRSMPEIIVVIDRVMALFLARYNQIERGTKFLMVALPSSKVQPYIPQGSIPPEMFIGRAEELEKIQNPNGPVFIYGGRQLGKTALLREIKNREHDPDNGRFAIFVDLKTKGVGEAVRRISEELVVEHVLDRPYPTWEELSTALRSRLGSKERPIRKLMLLLDEADYFILECEKELYRPLEMLKELKDSYNDCFKFVLAGLRDVVRFNKSRLKANSVLAHLEHITIRPLKYVDARNLLLRPLQYLGFRISEQSEEIISLILAKTNYYPGLIHFYGQKLIEAIPDSYGNGTYSDNSAPPYVLDEKHIKTLLGQSEFLVEIEEKFQITLQLDNENLYDILAKAMAQHYHDQGIGCGASVQDIIRICQDFEIHKIGKMSDESVRALLEEMEELNIFRQETRGIGKYVFNRYSFFQMLGNKDQVFNHLFEYFGLEEGIYG